MGRCPICNKLIDKTFKQIFDNQYGNVCICKRHPVELGGK